MKTMNIRNIFFQFKEGLYKTRIEFANKLDFLFSNSKDKSDFLEKLEELLILSDLGTSATAEIMNEFQQINFREYKENNFIFFKEKLKVILIDILNSTAPDIKINDKINITIDALGKKQFTTQIIRKHPVIDIISRQGMVEAILASPPKGAMPGQLSRVNFISKTKDYLSIPLSAIRHDQHSAYVYLLKPENKTVYKQEITMGITIGDFVEITRGLKQGEKIVIKGQYGLKSGTKVQIITSQEYSEINSKDQNDNS